MARKPLRPLIRSGGFYPSRKWTPLVYAGGYTTANGGEEPAPPPIEKTVTGNPIHILDALAKPAQALSVKLEPIQDLHGYGNPWPAGGGKNLYDASVFATVTKSGVTCTNNGDGSFTLNGTATGDAYFDVFTYQFRTNYGGEPLPTGSYRLTGCPPNGSTSTYYMYITPSYTSDLGSGNTNTNTTVSGGSIFIKSGYTCDNLVFWPMLRLASNGDDTFAPYSNICPISGHTDADVVVDGKNLLDKANGSASDSNWWIGASGKGLGADGSFVLPSGTYTFSCSAKVSGLYAIDKNNTQISVVYNNTKVSFTLSETKAIKLMLYNSAFSTSDWADVNIQLELGSTATAYTPYVGTTYPIPLGTTVYGGQLDVTSGVLTVDRALSDINSLSWQYSSQYSRFETGSLSSIIIRGASARRLQMISSVFLCISDGRPLSSVPDMSFYEGGNGTVYIHDSQYSDASAFVSALTGQTICYPLATPQTIQLTAQQVELLQGENNIFSDGEMTLVYLADGNASDVEALNILLGGRYTNTHGEDEPTDREALNIILGGNER